MGNTEYENRVLVADLIPPPFAQVLATGDVFNALVRAGKIWHLKSKVSKLHSASSDLVSEEELNAKVMLIDSGKESAAEVVGQIEELQ